MAGGMIFYYFRYANKLEFPGNEVLSVSPLSSVFRNEYTFDAITFKPVFFVAFFYGGACFFAYFFKFLCIKVSQGHSKLYASHFKIKNDCK